MSNQCLCATKNKKPYPSSLYLLFSLNSKALSPASRSKNFQKKYILFRLNKNNLKIICT